MNNPPLAALPPWLSEHWLAALLGLAGLAGLVAALALRRRRPGVAFSLLVAGPALLVFAAGGLAVPAWLGGWLAFGAAGAFAVAGVVLLLTGAWSRAAALALAAAGLAGLGGLLLPGGGPALVETAGSLADMRLRAPAWLFLLFALPVIARLAWPRLGRHELRPWLALGLRLVGVAVLALALAEPYFSQASRAMTVLFVVDRSLSIPEEPGEDPSQPGGKVDLRAQRVLKWINDAVAMRGAGHERDQAGLVVFARQPRLELPPSDAPRFNLRELPPADDGNYTNIAQALKLALASFPEGTARRIVLVSDGNQNLGDAEEQARLAKSLGVQIDVLPLAAGRRNTEEVLVERVDAPPVVEQGARVPIRVLVRSHHPGVVVGRLVLRQITDKEGSISIRLGKDGSLGVEVEPAAAPVKGVQITSVAKDSAAGLAGLEPGEEIVQVDGADVKGPAGLEVLLARRKAGDPVRLTMRRNPVKVVGVRDPARLRLGLNPFSFDRPLSDEQRSYTYEAEFQPLLVEDEKGKVIQKGLPGDRVQNNRASTHVVARGQGRILLLENQAGQHTELVERLVEAGKGRFKVVAEPVDVLDNYKERDKLAVFLSNFDCVIVANVPAERISEEQQEVIRSNTHDQGCGLVMIGGPEGFGAGGWQNTPIEKALPVDCDIRSLKVQGKGGLVLIMHASEMARGNYWQKKIAKLAVERLGPGDEVGILVWSIRWFWHVKMQPVGPNRAAILSAIEKLSPGDIPDVNPALQMAQTALTDPAKEFGAKHIIFISDGDHWQHDPALRNRILASKITIATVGVATHGPAEDKKMAALASNPRRYYKVTDPKQLPAIYIKESRLVSQAFVYRKAFSPRLVYRSGPTAKLPELLPLGGFVRTTRKESPLVEVPVVSPQMADSEFPILAYWHYGLGKAVAYTSDAGKPEFWSRGWLAGAAGREGIFAGFWEQVLGWALRPVESGRLVMNTEYRDGKVRVVVEARTPDGRPDTSLRLRAGLTPPAGKGGEPGRKEELRFAQKNAGLYEAEVKAEEAGSYFITAQATRVRKVKQPGEKEPREVEEALDSVRAGVTLPYSPEFAELESNTPLLERLAEMTDGRSYEEDPELLAEAARSGAVFRAPLTRSRSALPFHYWLLFLAAGLLLLDVAVRRLAFDPHESAQQARVLWARLRGFPLPPPVAAPAVGRLRARPAEVAQPERAGRRYEGGPVTAPPAVVGGPPRSAAPRSPAAEAPSPEKPAEPGGLEDLLRAKKRVWEERKKADSEQ